MIDNTANMADRELLELAAKAVGADTATVKEMSWNPLADNEEALHLATTLHMQIAVWHHRVFVTTTHRASGDEDAEEFENGDLLAAVRRAIVRVAAEIGKG